MRCLSTLLLVFFVGLLGTTNLGCNSCGPRSTGRAKIVVSIFPLYDLTRRIAGPDADVVLLVQPGASPRNFTPTEAQTAQMGEAKLAVMVGLGLDPWMETRMKSVASKARVLRAGDRVRTISAEGGGDVVDAHVWLDPERGRLMVKAIAEEMARVDAVHANAFRSRANELDAQLEKLDKELEAKTAAWKNKEIVAKGSDFVYFADRYGLKSVSSPRAPAIDSLGGEGATTTYEGLLRRCASALEENQNGAP